jgi:hypothetical protein
LDGQLAILLDGKLCIQPHPKTGYLANPPASNELEAKLQLAYAKIQKTITSHKWKKEDCNLSEQERETLRDLRRKPFIFLPSDKGGEFCVVEESQYNQLALQHLSDPSSYKPVKHMAATTIEKKISAVWNGVCKTRKITDFVRRSYNSSNTSLPRFYHLIKTHKEGPETKIRPIISNVDGPTCKIAWLLARMLKPLLKLVPAHLESSLTLMYKLEAMDETAKLRHGYPCSLDVVSLYTSIPPGEAIRNAEEIMRRNNFNMEPLTIEDTVELLEVILRNTYFTFGKSIFLQVGGLAMGSSISAILAILFMDTLERTALLSFTRLGFYARYVDDILALVEDRTAAMELLDIMNNQHANIKFELEHPDGSNSLGLLDFRITIDGNGELMFDFYKKKAKRDVFVHANSALPCAAKMNIIKNETQRISERCCNDENKEMHLEAFENKLRRNGYSQNFIEKCKVPKRRRNRPPEANGKPPLYFNMPFIADGLNLKIKRIFQQEGLNVRVYSKNKSLRQLLATKRTDNETCSMNQCPVADPKLCHRRNVVYQIRCTKCNRIYIGSTIRQLHTRVKEHLQSDQSSVKRHLAECHSTSIAVEVLAHDSDEKNLRLREAILIMDGKPEMNAKEEEKVLLSLVRPVK